MIEYSCTGQRVGIERQVRAANVVYMFYKVVCVSVQSVFQLHSSLVSVWRDWTARES
jgi:hypothetical protein